MQSITLRSHVGPDGTLNLNIPTQLSDTDLEIVIWLRPLKTTEADKQEPFSQWWAKELETISLPDETSDLNQDPRFRYLAERYNL